MIAAIFPGQGSQKPGMARELVANLPEAREVFDTISAALSLDLQKLCFDTDEETLRKTENAQIALFASSVAAYKTLNRGDLFAGHSVGEYAALVCSGVLTVEEGAKLVQTRGQIMATSGQDRAGTMAAVLGLDRQELEAVCKASSNADEVAVIANDNCPGQLVISGDTAAVLRASAAATEAGAKRVIPLNVSGAFHSPLMEVPAKKMGDALRSASFTDGISVIANVTAEPETSGWPNLLELQLKSPVRWTETVQKMVTLGATTFVEYGVGEVLCGLVRRISREVATCAVYDLASLEKAKEVSA